MSINRRDLLGGVSVAGGVMALRGAVSAKDFGALGNGVADDRQAIQDALDQVGSQGGGTVFLPPVPVHYRLGAGLKLPSHTTLEGSAPVRYPFNAGNKGSSALVADFADPRQWVLESRTLVGGRPVSFNAIVGGGLPDGVTYNCCVRNLLITAKGKTPFGGVRMHGCPGSIVSGVSINNVGCGLLVNCCSGGDYNVHVNAAYYGVAVWEEVNACTFDLYCSQHDFYPAIVPDDYVLPFMKAAAGSLKDVYHLRGAGHHRRPFGVLVGALKSTSVNNVFDVVAERFNGGMFLLNAYATDFRKCYLEGSADQMAFAIVASKSRFGVQALHAYMSGTGALFDLGTELLAKVYASGIVNPASFGSGPRDDGTSLLLMEGLTPGLPNSPQQRNVQFAYKVQAWVEPKLAAGRAANQGTEIPGYRLNPRTGHVEFKGSLSMGPTAIAFILPAALRPARKRQFAVVGGRVSVTSTGEVWVTATEEVLSLDGIFFEPAI